MVTTTTKLTIIACTIVATKEGRDSEWQKNIFLLSLI